MRNLTSLLVCLAASGNGRRVQNLLDRWHLDHIATSPSEQVMSSLNVAAAFDLPSSRLHLQAGRRTTADTHQVNLGAHRHKSADQDVFGLRRPDAKISRHWTPNCCDSGLPPAPVSVQVSFEDGGSQLVTLASPADIGVAVSELASEYALTEEQISALEDDLSARWEDAQAGPPVYAGPTPPDSELSNRVASVELSNVGLALDVADSVAVGGGRGLFMRCLPDAEVVTLSFGTAVCGYARGEMRITPDIEGGKCVAFSLSELDMVVWFEKELRQVGDLLADDSIDTIAGHTAIRDELGNLLGVTIDDKYDGPRYFVVSEEQPAPLDLTAMGQMANDLAIVGDEAVLGDDTPGNTVAQVSDGPTTDLREEEYRALYDEASQENNLLMLVFRLERDEQNPRLLVPTRPVSTLSRDMSFANRAPMEIGCKYGGIYWKNKAELDAARQV